MSIDVYIINVVLNSLQVKSKPVGLAVVNLKMIRFELVIFAEGIIKLVQVKLRHIYHFVCVKIFDLEIPLS